MSVHRFTIECSTEGNCEVVNLHPEIARKLAELTSVTPAAGRGPGLLSLLAVGSTVALTTLEFEIGLVKHDLPRLLQRLIPDDARYDHEATWHDDNGHSHLRSSLIGPGVTLPTQDGRLVSGEYQQVVLVDFDTRPRRRTVVATLIV